MRPRLLILSFSHIASDARVLKQVKHFADRYDVTTFGYGPSPDTRVEHVQLPDDQGIRRWHRSDLILRRFEHIYWRQPAVQTALAALRTGPRFEVILANDIDAVGLALALEPTRGVHADIHEYAPRQNEELLIWRIFIAPFVRWMCRTFLPAVASMTTVGQGIAEEYRRVYGVRAEVVTNASPYADLAPQPVTDTIRLVHSGASLRNRRLEVLIDAVMSTRTDVTLDLYLMGNDPDYVTELKSRAATSARVRFPDAVSYHELITRLNTYDVGMHVIAPTNFNNRLALPNKFFDYVQARLGLIIGPSVEMERLLTAHELGAIADGFDAAAVAEVLDQLTPDKVASWKQHADASARALSAESQVEIWGRAIAALTDRVS